MTYKEYIDETINNCKIVLAECSAGELLDIEHLKSILWEDDRVTGVISGYCTSTKETATNNISGILFDGEFLADFNEHKLDMQIIMAHGAEAIDIVARCLALNHINIVELSEHELEIRLEKDHQTHVHSSKRV